MAIRTTHVGSLPRPDNLTDENIDEAIFNVVKMQVEAGLEEVNDGEYRRSVFFGDISGLPGFKQHAFPIVASAGDEVQVGVVEGKIQYDPASPLAAKEVASVKAALEKLGEKRRIKVSIPSLSWMSIFYPDPRAMPYKDDNFIGKAAVVVREFYPTLEDYLEEMKGVIINEARAAIEAGAETVQFDSPDLLQFDVYGQYLNDRDKEKLKWAIGINNEVLQALPQESLQVHSCWGNLMNTQFNTLGHYDLALPELYELKAGTIGPLEVFDGIRDYEELKYFGEYPRPKGTYISLGLVSVKSRNVEPTVEIKRRYEAATKVVDEDKLIVSPGCGFASDPKSIHSMESARKKLSNMVQALKRD
ncbi:MAG: hypothetical protein JRN10_07640 [Nitrososphaerota archaeon]|nr:hypothetical protein [Nitrososphaerota archaeon]